MNFIEPGCLLSKNSVARINKIAPTDKNQLRGIPNTLVEVNAMKKILIRKNACAIFFIVYTNLASLNNNDKFYAASAACAMTKAYKLNAHKSEKKSYEAKKLNGLSH